MRTKTKIKNTIFYENFLINLQLGNFFNPSSEKRAKELNSPESSTKHNQEMIEAAQKEMQKPIEDTISGTRDEIKKFAGLPKRIFKTVANAIGTVITAPPAIVGSAATHLLTGTAAIGTQLITNPIGLVANIPRYGADLVRLAARPPLIVADYLGKFAGYPSAIIKSTRERALSAIKKGNEKILSIGAGIRNRVLSTIGADAEGSHAEAAHAHG